MKTWLKGKFLTTSLLTLTSLFATYSCSNVQNDNLSAIASPAISGTVTKSSIENSNEPLSVSAQFLSDLKKEKINLSEEEIVKLNKLINVQPTGEWTPGPENDSKANLKKHFLKHGHEFKPKYETQEDYLKGAIKASKNECEGCSSYFDTSYYKNDKMVSVVRWNPKTLDFSVTRENGQIATYFVNKVKTPRFILIKTNNKKGN